MLLSQSQRNSGVFVLMDLIVLRTSSSPIFYLSKEVLLLHLNITPAAVSLLELKNYSSRSVRFYLEHGYFVTHVRPERANNAS